MDVLSDVITVLRTGEPRSARLEFRGPWGQWFEPFPGSAGFHVVLQGPCWLLRPPADPVALGAGDVVFRPHGGPHALADSATPAYLEPACRPDDARRLQRYASETIGTGGTSVTVTLCGAYEFDPGGGHPLLDALPEVVHLPAHLGRNPGLRSTVDLLAAELAQPRLGTDAIIPALLDTLLLYVLRTWFDTQPASGATGWAAALNDPFTAAALRAIHGDPGPPVDGGHARRRGGPVAGAVRPEVRRAAGPAAADLCHVVADDHRGAPAARVRPAVDRGGGAGRVRVGVRVLGRVQAAVRGGPR